MEYISSYYENYCKIWNALPPETWNFETISKSQTIVKATQEAEKTFNRLAVAGILVGAFAFKFITSPIWLPTFLFAGITALACYALSLTFHYTVKKFEKWRELPEEQIQEIIAPLVRDAIKNCNDSTELLLKFKEIELILNLKIVSYAKLFNITPCLAFERTFSSLQKMDILWEANTRQMLIIFPFLNSNDSPFFVLEYIKYINRRIESDPNALNNFHSHIFHEQFKLLNWSESGQFDWEGIHLIDNKKMVVFVAQCFPLEQLAQTCELLQKNKNITVGIIFHPGKIEEKKQFDKLAQKYSNIHVKMLTAEEAAAFSLQNVPPF